MPELVCVDPEKVPQVWPFVSTLIEAAYARGGFGDFGSIRDDVAAARALLWLVWDGKDVLAASITQVSIENADKICTIAACGGHDKARWLHLISEIEKYAKGEGCARVRICGRRGWTKALDDYRVRAIVLEKAL
jgi:hypothetical protein